MKRTHLFLVITIMLQMMIFNTIHAQMSIQIFETSAKGNKLEPIKEYSSTSNNKSEICIFAQQRFQTIIGFGGSFTEASAYLINKMSKTKRAEIIEAYFGETGARYSLTRTHINSCDFSLSQYSYAPTAGDKELNGFSIAPDKDDIIPMILDAKSVSKEGFKIISSPWTAPPWMKDNLDWRGGKLLPEYYDTWALYFSKYLTAYLNEGIDIWGITVENEPLGCGNNWESMHYSPQEMTNFVNKHLGKKLAADGHKVKILGYDQNRGNELKKWVDVMYANNENSNYYDGVAIHWYASTYDWFPASLQYTHRSAPNKLIIQTEACADAEVPIWKDDLWYWKKEATDWGWDWAPEKDKYLHPKYAPVYRYASDIIGCMNNWVNGWIDWNMVLDKQGGPNWFKNWCLAPVIVDTATDEVYFTPLYYVMVHFSKFIRPGAVRIGFRCNDKNLMVTAVQNPDSTIVVVVLNQSESDKELKLKLGQKTSLFRISGQALQTFVVN